MKTKHILYYSSYFIILICIFVSGYLLFSHYAISIGKPLETDLCSLVFGKGCAAAALSSVSQFMKIPIAGWGLIYASVIGCYLLISQIIFKANKNVIIQIAFWLSAFGILLSIYYLILMLLSPILFCPFCAIFHIVNFALFFLIKKITNLSILELFKGLFTVLGIVFLGKSIAKHFSNWKWLAVIFPLLLGLSIYQWTLLQDVSITNEQLASYNPLEEIEKFESQKIWKIKVEPNDPFLGTEDAPVTLVVFSDFQCSLCKMFATNFESLIKYNKEKLKIVFKYFPLSSSCNPIATNDLHPLACQAALAAQAANLQGKFWEYHNLLFDKELDDNPDIFIELAKAIDLNLDKFTFDFNSMECRKSISSHINEGLRLKLDGTPSAFLNGRAIKSLSEQNINFLIKFLAH